MKKILKLIMVLGILILTIDSNTVRIYAFNNSEMQIEISRHTEILKNGIVMETILYEDTNLFRANVKSGRKTVNYKNSNDEILWYVQVVGTFEFDGKSSNCTNVSVYANSNNSNWYISNKKASKMGNTAIGSATGELKVLGLVIQSINKEVQLTCSPNGGLS